MQEKNDLFNSENIIRNIVLDIQLKIRSTILQLIWSYKSMKLILQKILK